MNDLRILIFLVFGAIALINHLRRNAMAQLNDQRADAEAPNRPQKSQSDIEAFLSEVRAATEKKPRQEQSGQQVSKQSHPRKQQSHRRDPQRSEQRHTKATPVRTRSLGTGVNEHVETYISQHVAEHVESNVDNFVEIDIVNSVESHLGNRSEELSELTRTETPLPTAADEFRKLLRSQSGVRQAILLNEILKKPRALQR
ncbi:MAG: hypothetical protein MK102_07385 [Fuerstiella sp.]|nr:hypothetical protein [Fuerstiella sp.]